MNSKKIKLIAISVAMVLSTQMVLAEDLINDFGGLKDALKNATGSSVTVKLGSDISANDRITTGGTDTPKSVTILGEGKKYTSTTLAFDVKPNTELTLNNITLHSIQQGSSWGGAMYNEGTLTLDNVIFNNNIAKTSRAVGGGAMALVATRSNPVSTTIKNSTFTNNSTNSNPSYENNGGAIYVYGTSGQVGNNTLNISDSHFESNHTNKTGGAICVNNLGPSVFEIEIKDTTFKKNYSTGYGGAIDVTTGGTGNVTINLDNATFDGNKSKESDGGAIAYEKGNITSNIINSTFTNNTANNGGAIYNGIKTLKISNTIFDGNKTNDGGKGGAIYNAGSISLNQTEFKQSTDTIYMANDSTADFSGTNTLNGSISSENATSEIKNKGTLILNADNSGYTGTYTQESGQTDVNYSSKFFEGSSKISGGQLNWNTNNDLQNGSLIVDSAKLVVGNDAQLSIKGNSDISKATKVTINDNANLNLVGKTMTIANISGNGTLTADGSILTYDKNSGVTKGFASKNSSNVTVNGTDNSNVDSIIGAIVNGSNVGLTLNFEDLTTNKDISLNLISEDLGADISNLNTSGNVAISGKLINNAGTVTNSGTLTLSGTTENNSNLVNDTNSTLNINGTFTGKQTATITNNGIINVKDNASGFDGKLDSYGDVIVDNSSYLFGGEKNINSGKLNISSGAVKYGNITLGSGAQLNHIIDSTVVGNINSATFKFADDATGAKANFKTSNGVKSNLNLSKIDNGKSNTISISNSNITLAGNNYKGNTIYDLKNSSLNLIEQNPEKFANYEFDNLLTENTTLDFNVRLNRNDDGNTLTTDTVTVNNTDAIFKIGNLYISGDKENGQRGEYKTENNVLGGNAKFDTSTSTIADNIDTINGTTSSWTYKVSLDGDQSIKMEILNYVDDKTLNAMNILDGKRFFQFSENDNNVYEIAASLDPTESGNFYVSGADNSSNTLSGGGTKSFFNIASDKTTELEINRVTIENAKKTGNGSVVENNSANSTVKITNSTIQNNYSTGDGGAIYNGVSKADGEDNLIISGTVFEGNGAAGNGGAIYNAGDMTIANSKFEAGTESAKNDIYMAVGSNLAFAGKNTISNTISSEDSNSKITNSGNLTITKTGSADDFAGKFTQTAGSTTVEGKFFGGDSEISAGSLLWYTDNDTNDNSKITIKDGASLLIGEDKNVNSSLTLKNDSKIEEGAIVQIQENSKLNLQGSSDVTLNDNDAWVGTINLVQGSNGTLTTDNLVGNGTLHADGGNLNLKSGNLFIEGDSYVKQDSTVTIQDSANMIVSNGGDVTLAGTGTNSDTWSGNVILRENGHLTAGGFNSNGKLIASGGTLDVVGGRLNVIQDSIISKEVKTTIYNDSELNITNGGIAQINDNDQWEGKVSLNGGRLDLIDYDNTITQGQGFEANTGNLHISNSTFNMYDNYTVAKDVDVALANDSKVILQNGSEFNLNENDYWGGSVEVVGGHLIGSNIHFDGKNGAKWQQSSGTSTFNNSYVELNDENSFIGGGDLNLINSGMRFGADSISMSADNLYMKNSSINTLNGWLEEHEISSNMNVNGTNHFGIDVAPRLGNLGESDLFTADKIISDNNGTINIADFSFVGLAPIDRHLKFQVFKTNSIGDNIKFTATDKEIFTPIGYYNIQSAGGGWFTSNLTRYNPQVFRGQVATLATYNNQLVIDDMLLNHVTLDSERLLAQSKNANTYASTLPQFAPYQYKKEDGGLWYKSYVTFENLSLTQGLKVGNNAYGSLVGADFPVIKLKHGWRLMPTAYIGYNGAHQTFNGVGMYQNGGQGGLMGTFMKDNFIGSVVAYGGGYNNEMSVAGNTDRTGNWFAGTAAKLAYNFHPTKHFTIQPTAFMSYNIFGRQNWGTDFGSMSMNSGLLNGINVAPGMNFIYARETWSVYATFQYMYNINEQVGGKAGNVDLASVKMEHGYIQYGLGVTKTWKDRLNSFFQIVFRNGGRTGVGFQLGLNYTFDWLSPKSNKAPKANAKQIKKSTTSNKKSQEIKEFQHVGSKTVLKSLSMK